LLRLGIVKLEVLSECVGITAFESLRACYGREPTCGDLRGTRAKQKARIESGSCRGLAQSRMLGLDDTAALPGGTLT
jgi:hypothetical protein